LQFNQYLKSCREHSQLTQEELVHALYSHNIDDFHGLDTTTLSKWERGITQPKISKQINIIKYFQERTNAALPCWESYSVKETEKLICKVGMKNLLGKSKALILNFPDKMIAADDLKVSQLRNSEMIDKVIDINIDLDKGFNHKFTELLPEHFKEWALHPSNSFFICEYKDQFFGLLFTLRLKPNAFEKIINFEIKEKDLTTNDFASFNEIGSNYIISFFSMNEKSASMLFIRYYAHLIANQKVIEEVGVATMMEDAKKIIDSINLKYHSSTLFKEDLELQSYKETLPNFLASENVIKMILSKQDCPEEA
jgi:transcriptional regulator with XRE-family HTH domain